MADIIDINVNETVEEVTINVVNDVIQVNINKVTNTAGVPYVGATQDVNLGEFGLLTGNIELDNTPTNIPTTAGSIYWNDADGTADLILKGGNVKLQLGQEQVIRVVNKTATNVNLLESNYQAVRVTGAQGQRLKVDLAQATNDILSAETIGLVTETINNNQEGFITTSGLVRNINTTGSLQGETWADGDILYLSPTVAGRITKVKPSAPNHLVVIGYVIHAHATQGSIFVKVDNGYELDELHNVKITTPLNNESLVYNSTLEVWENKSIDLQSVVDEGNELTTDINVKSTRFKIGDLDEDNSGVVVVIDNDGGGVSFQKQLVNIWDFAEGTFGGINNLGNSFGFSFDELTSNVSINQNDRQNGVYSFAIDEIDKTANFIADNYTRYTANGTLTVTDPTPVTNKGFIVHVIGGSVTIGGVAYTSGALVYRYYDGSSWISTNMNSAITIDATPTDGSSNAVSSNGVFDALADIDLFQTKDNYNMWRAGASVVFTYGTSLVPTFSSVTARTLTNTNAYTRSQRFGILTSSTAGSVASYRLGALHFLLDGLDYFEQTIGTAEGSSTADMRCIFGIFLGTGALNSNIEYNTLGDFIGLGRITGSNNWHILHNDASGTATTIDLGASFPANVADEKFTFRITALSTTSCDFKVTRLSTGVSSINTISANIPALNQLFTYKGSHNNNTNAVVYGFDFFAVTEKFN